MKSCCGLSGWSPDMKKVDWRIVGQGRKRQVYLVRSAFQGSVISLFSAFCILIFYILPVSCFPSYCVSCSLQFPIHVWSFFSCSLVPLLSISHSLLILYCSPASFLLFCFLQLLCYIWQNLPASGFLSFLLWISVLYLCILYPCLSLHSFLSLLLLSCLSLPLLLLSQGMIPVFSLPATSIQWSLFEWFLSSRRIKPSCWQ